MDNAPQNNEDVLSTVEAKSTESAEQSKDAEVLSKAAEEHSEESAAQPAAAEELSKAAEEQSTENAAPESADGRRSSRRRERNRGAAPDEAALAADAAELAATGRELLDAVPAPDSAAEGKHLQLVAQGGLCNRLRLLLSALSLVESGLPAAAIAPRQLTATVVWKPGADCGASFDDLFEPLTSEGFTITDRRRWFDRPQTRQNLHWPALVRRAFYTVQRTSYNPTPAQLAADLRLAGQRGLYASGGYALCDQGAALVSRLTPRPHLRERIGQITARFTPTTVGVHIRRTDHAVCIAASPASAFLEAMHAVLSYEPDALFYVATDDAQLKQHLQLTFPGHILTQPCSGSRSDRRGVEEAVVDLYALAACSRILGSYWSSFTAVAADLSGRPAQIIRGRS